MLSILLLKVALWNAKMNSPEKGFYAMSYLLSLFAAVAVQKNVRDVALMSDASQEPVSGPGGAVFADSTLVRQRQNLSVGLVASWIFKTSEARARCAAKQLHAT